MDPHASALDTAAAIRSKEVSPLEVLEATLARIDRRNPDVNAVIWRNDDAARVEAKALGDRIARGDADLPPFAGVPLPIKELLEVAGQPVTYGCAGAPDTPAEESELVARAFVAAGFVLCGRTNSPEFGSVSITENNRFGATRNPWDTGFTPGGSSGGAAAAVASGMFPAANASDGGGSIRIPASCCGLVGHKPSRGRVPDRVPGWSGLSVEGAVTRTVADSAAILEVISGPDPLAWWSSPPKARPYTEEVGADPGRLRIAVNTESALGVEVAPECLAAVDHAVTLLESLGHEVYRLDGDLFDPAELIHFLNLMRSGFGAHLDIDPAGMEPHNRVAYEAGRGLDSLEYIASLSSLQRQSRRQVARFGDEFDLLVTPDDGHRTPAGGTARPGARPARVPADGGRVHGRVHGTVQHHRSAGRESAAPRGGFRAADRGPDRGRCPPGRPADPGGLAARGGRPLDRPVPAPTEPHDHRWRASIPELS